MHNIVSKDSIHNMHIPIRLTHHFIAENEYGSDMSRHVNSIVKTITMGKCYEHCLNIIFNLLLTSAYVIASWKLKCCLVLHCVGKVFQSSNIDFQSCMKCFYVFT